LFIFILQEKSRSNHSEGARTKHHKMKNPTKEKVLSEIFNSDYQGILEEKENKIQTKKFYRVITPSTFSNQTYISTLEKAQDWIKEWSGLGLRSRSKYWEQQAALCKIEEVTETFIQIK